MNRIRENYRLMAGRQVAQHLLAAETSSRQNETYDFPGGIRFPINNFDFNNLDHHPFPDDERFTWNLARLLRGHKIFSEMLSKWLDDMTLKHMKILEMPGLGQEVTFKLTPRNQRQPEQGEYRNEVIISRDAPRLEDERSQSAIADLSGINNEESVQPCQTASHVADQVTNQNVATIMAEVIEIDMEFNIDPADNQSVQPNANTMNAVIEREIAQVQVVEHMEVETDIDVNVDANQANDNQNQNNENQSNDNHVEADAPDNNDIADILAALIDPNATPPVRRPFIQRPRRNLPQDDFFQIDPPKIGNRPRSQHIRRNPNSDRRLPAIETYEDFVNVLDMFENQLCDQPSQPQDIQPEAGVSNEDVQSADVDVPIAEAQGNAPPHIDDQDFVNVGNFAQNEPQSSALSPILEIENVPRYDHSNVIDSNSAFTVQPVQRESSYTNQSGNVNIIQNASAQIGAQAAPETEQQHQIPANELIEVEIDPPAQNDPETERQLIRAEIARWRRNFYRATHPRKRAPPRSMPLPEGEPDEFAVQRASCANNMVHPRLALEDMTKVYRIIHEFLARPDNEPVPIEDYLRRFLADERFKALIGLTDAVLNNSILIDVEENDEIIGFHRITDQQ